MSEADSIVAVVRELRSKGIDVSKFHALEMFGGDGNRVTVYYAKEVASLEIWEIDSQFRDALKERFPNADIRVVDTFREVKRREATFDFILVDNPSCRCVGGHYEHFDLFPDVFRLCHDGTIIVVNVIPTLAKNKMTWKGWLDVHQIARATLRFSAQLRARRNFYKVKNSQSIPFDVMYTRYERLAKDNGFEISWHFFQQRSAVYYLTMKLRKFQVPEVLLVSSEHSSFPNRRKQGKRLHR